MCLLLPLDLGHWCVVFTSSFCHTHHTSITSRLDIHILPQFLMLLFAFAGCAFVAIKITTFALSTCYGTYERCGVISSVRASGANAIRDSIDKQLDARKHQEFFTERRIRRKGTTTKNTLNGTRTHLPPLFPPFLASWTRWIECWRALCRFCFLLPFDSFSMNKYCIAWSSFSCTRTGSNVPMKLYRWNVRA